MKRSLVLAFVFGLVTVAACTTTDRGTATTPSGRARVCAPGGGSCTYDKDCCDGHCLYNTRCEG